MSIKPVFNLIADYSITPFPANSKLILEIIEVSDYINSLCYQPCNNSLSRLFDLALKVNPYDPSNYSNTLFKVDTNAVNALTHYIHNRVYRIAVYDFINHEFYVFYKHIDFLL